MNRCLSVMKSLGARAAPIAVLLALWQAAVSWGLVNPDFLPSPYAISIAGLDLIRSGELWSNLGVTLLKSFGGLALALVIGVPAGMLMAKSRVADSLLGPLVKATYSLPKTALIPLFFLWFGIGAATDMISIMLACLLPLLVYAYHGVHAVPRVLVWSAECMGTPPALIFYAIELPASLAAILTGLRIALGFSFVLAISAEMIAAKSGIGKLMVEYGENGAYDYMFAAVSAIVIVAFAADRGLVALTDHALRWQAPHHSAGAA
jgi:ABC-type nitrate/sulfonate/bicarbonate transport system permease component